MSDSEPEECHNSDSDPDFFADDDLGESDNVRMESSDDGESDNELSGVGARGDGGPSSRKRGRGTPTTTRQPLDQWEWRVLETDDIFEPGWVPQYGMESGPQVNTTNFSERDFFRLFFHDNVIHFIVQETNRYAAQHAEANNYSEKSRKNKWKETTFEEIEAYIGLQIAMGLCQKASLSDYWDTTHWLTATPSFSQVMSRNRYQLLCSFLHFCDNTQRVDRGERGYNPLFKIQKLLDEIVPTFRECYVPGKNLAIDESMVRFKGRIHLKQYMPAKPIKWGFKIFVLADSATHYCLNLQIYTGKTENQTDSISAGVVHHLLTEFKNKGHVVFTDSYYTSPDLFLQLKQENTGACGTVSDNRKHFPAELKKKNLKLKRGNPPKFAALADDSMLAVSWMDNKQVSLISTVDGNGLTEKRVRAKGQPDGRLVHKPDLIENYNSNMSGVDHFDQVSVNYPYPHKSSKWYLPLFHFLVETCIVNAYIMHKRSAEKTMSAKKFRQLLCASLVAEAVNSRRVASAAPTPRAAPTPVNRLSATHLVDKYANKKYKPRCIVCNAAGKRGQTSFFCSDCNVPLCVSPCFKLYHTIDDYARRRRQLLE